MQTTDNYRPLRSLPKAADLTLRFKLESQVGVQSGLVPGHPWLKFFPPSPGCRLIHLLKL